MRTKLLKALAKSYDGYTNFSINNDVYHGIIYHYTSPDGFLKILHPKENDNRKELRLWFTKCDSLNDKEERIHFSKYLKEDYCPSRIKNGTLSQSFVEMIESLEPSDDQTIFLPNGTVFFSKNQVTSTRLTLKPLPCDTYLCCFSEEPDLLPMWNYYTKSQHYEGYNIGFRSEYFQNFILSQGYRLNLNRAIYSSQEKAELLDTVLCPLNDVFTPDSITEDEKMSIQTVAQSIIDNLQFLFKHPAFQHEKEVRAILQVPKNSSSPFKKEFRNSNGYIVPYIEYPVPLEAVKEITIAPLLEAEISKQNIAEMLRERGFGSGIKINTSSIPIRF